MRQVEVDAMLELGEITDRGIEEVWALGPFGAGNPPPLFAAMNVEVAAAPVIMKEKHLRVTVRQNGRTLTLKSWNSMARTQSTPFCALRGTAELPRSMSATKGAIAGGNVFSAAIWTA